MSERDVNRKLGDLFQQAHRTDSPPPFQRLWSAPSGRQGRRRQLFTWASAVGVMGVIAVLAGLHGAAIHQHRQRAQQVVWTERTYPLAFLLDTPGADLLSTVPSFGTKGEWP
jgi:hypothetical protein